MPSVHGVTSRILNNGADVSAFISSFTVAASTDEAETTIMQPNATAPNKRFIPGAGSGEFTADGPWDDDALSFARFIAALQARGGSTIWTGCPGEDVVGQPCENTVVVDTIVSQVTDVADAVRLSVGGTAIVGIEHSIVLHALSAEVATGDGSSVDNTAGTTNGGAGYLHVTAVSGAGTFDCIIEQSTTGAFAGEETTLLTFAGVTAADSAERVNVVVATTIDRFTRVSFTLTGFTSVTFHVGLHRR